MRRFRDGPISAAAGSCEGHAGRVGPPRPGFDGGNERKEGRMLGTLVIIFLVLWLLGLVTSYTMGGLIHLLLVACIVVVLLRVIQGRRVA